VVVVAGPDRPGEREPGDAEFLPQLAVRRLGKGLTRLNPAAGHEPHGAAIVGISRAEEKDPIGRVEKDDPNRRPLRGCIHASNPTGTFHPAPFMTEGWCVDRGGRHYTRTVKDEGT
jgi:hypothetical protein